MPLPKDPIKAEETRRKMSDANRGRKQSPETIAKRVAANTGQQRSPRIKRNCAFCGKEMILLDSGKNRKFCSRVCKGKWQSENRIGEKGAHWQGGDVTKNCEECGKEFSVGKTRMETARFCSFACKGKWQSENRVGEKGAHWQGGDVTKNCVECGKEFSVGKARSKTARFCSQHCKGIWLAKHDKLPKFPHMFGPESSRWTGGELTKKCEECGKEFDIKRYRKEKARFCSTTCKGIWLSKNNVGDKNPTWRRVVITCEECGKEFQIKKSQIGEGGRRNFCSVTCKGIWMSKNLVGENNSNWTGGPKDYCEKWSLEFRRRIRAFFKYQCAECGTPQNEKKLHCHHVYYDKKACCSVNEDGRCVSNLGIKDNPLSFEILGDPNKFIALCDNCHKKTSGKKNREYWARHFEEIINQDYLGRSYFTKEEYEKLDSHFRMV